ncbi:MAG TPA: Calx-beta domain-containing protein [Thermoanaerobaculia bacterium]|nr:Calx-beta domain-containing protein [Thermoanaerobaculia bacterium]
MLHRITLPALALGFLLATAASGQHHHMGVDPKDYDDGGGRGGDTNPPAGCSGVDAKITITGTSFSPSTITVDPGQPVCWIWTQSTAHNVHADDDSFTSGGPANNGTFQTTFTTAGSHGFYCQVHGTATGGMRGTVVVRGAGDGGGGGGEGSGHGTIALSPTAYTVNEAAGVVTVTVERAGGSDGKASVKFATAPGSAKSNKDFTTRKGTLNWDSGDSSPKTIEVPIKKDSASEPDETFAVKLSKATGAALGAASATVTIHEEAPGCGAAVVQSGVRAGGSEGTDGSTAPCDETRAVCLNGGRFEAAVQWRPSAFRGDRSSKRVAMPEAPNTGLFASSPEEEPQVLLHVLDRCAVNGHYWLDLAAVTDIEFTVKVRDTQTGRTWVYANPAGTTPAPVRDAEAFATCP